MVIFISLNRKSLTYFYANLRGRYAKNGSYNENFQILIGYSDSATSKTYICAMIVKSIFRFRNYRGKKKCRFFYSRHDNSGIRPNFGLKYFFPSFLSMAENIGKIKKIIFFGRCSFRQNFRKNSKNAF